MKRKSFPDVLDDREGHEPKGIRSEDDVLVQLWMTRNENLLRLAQERLGRERAWGILTKLQQACCVVMGPVMLPCKSQCPSPQNP